MKVYKYNKTLDFGSHSLESNDCPLESDFLFETTQDVNIYDIFEYEGKSYSIRTVSIYGWAEAEEVDWNFEDDNTYVEDTIVCPICGERLETCDLSDWSFGDIDCPNCGAALEYQINYSFNTHVKTYPDVKKV